eukprot:168885-Amphidinium_carterae.1
MHLVRAFEGILISTSAKQRAELNPGVETTNKHPAPTEGSLGDLFKNSSGVRDSRPSPPKRRTRHQSRKQTGAQSVVD